MAASEFGLTPSVRLRIMAASGVDKDDEDDLQKSIDENDPENSALDSFSLELFEDISYIMAKHADRL